MNNPLRILQTLDRHLNAPAELTIFGRAALALGFARALPEFRGTHDVDGILPFDWLEAGDANLDFWLAVQATNRELESDDLYITHLFQEREIILRPDWASKRVMLRLPLTRLRVLRPSGLDLILTKMARGDGEDLADSASCWRWSRRPRNHLRRPFVRPGFPRWLKLRSSSG